MKNKNLLFITWDGPQTSYMEGLFMPIFQEIAKNKKVKFHVIQFTWASAEKTAAVQKVASDAGIAYAALPILRKPSASLGSFYTVFTASKKIEKYIQDHQIDIVMPRSTFPAMMVNRIKQKNFKLIFDADGLPIEERIDFAGLKRDSFQYQLMKSAETKMLKNADAVITRSQKAIEIHLKNIGEEYREKFSVVFNGRDQNKFKWSDSARTEARKKLGLNSEFVFVYAGSLGPQYCFAEMLEIFANHLKNEKSKFLILTGNIDFAKQHLPKELQSEIILKSVTSDEVPFYLSAADVAFALRQPSFSMQGVAPIKLGEYLLCGLPVIASKGIGDTEKILEQFKECYLYDHENSLAEQNASLMAFAENTIFADRNKIREEAQQFFSLEAAAESYIRVLEKLNNEK